MIQTFGLNINCKIKWWIIVWWAIENGHKTPKIWFNWLSVVFRTFWIKITENCAWSLCIDHRFISNYALVWTMIKWHNIQNWKSLLENEKNSEHKAVNYRLLGLASTRGINNGCLQKTTMKGPEIHGNVYSGQYCLDFCCRDAWLWSYVHSILLPAVIENKNEHRTSSGSSDVHGWARKYQLAKV